MANILEHVQGYLDRRLGAFERHIEAKLGGIGNSPIPGGVVSTGAIRTYLDDIKHILGVGGPKFVRAESFVFTAITDAAAPPVITPPDPARAEPGMAFAVHWIYGDTNIIAANVRNLGLVTYQVREEGRSQDVFRTRQRMAQICAFNGGTAGGGSPLELDVPYIFAPGADIRVDFVVAVGAAAPAAWAAGASTFSISLVGALYRV